MPADDGNGNPVPRRTTTPAKKKPAPIRRRRRTTGDRGATRTGAAKSGRTGPWRNVLLGGRSVSVGTAYGVRGRWSLGYHTGMDIRASMGTSLYVPEGGRVVSAGWGGAYGNTIVIKLKSGYYMRLAHLSHINVSKGQSLKAGQFVGKSGSTGNSTGPHLHLEIMKPGSGGRFAAGNFVNPLSYLNSHTSAATPTGGSGDGGSSGGSSSGGSSSSTSSPYGGSNIGGTSVGFSKRDFYAWLEANFGNVQTLLALDKGSHLTGGRSLRWAIDQMVKKKITDPDVALTYLNKTAWFKKYSADISARLVMEKQKPKLAKDEIAQKRSELATYLNQAGVVLSSAALNQMARNAWAYGWTNDTIIDQIQRGGKATFSGGNIAAGVDTLEQYANDFGVNLTDAEVRQFRQDFLDNKGDQGLRDAIQKRAAATYTVFADQLESGRSLKSLTSAYFDKAAQLLELDPNQIEWDDPLFVGGKAFTDVDPKTGRPMLKGLWDFEKEVRKDSRWQETQNARDSVIGTTGGILKQMGLM